MPVVDVRLLAAPAFSLSIGVDGVMRYAGVNDSLCRLTGLDAADLVGRTPSECLSSEIAAHVETQYRHCLKLGSIYEYEEHLDLPGGAKWWRTALSPILDPATDTATGLFGMSSDITDRKRDELELRSAAFKDPLTGICNRRRFDRDLDLAVSGALEAGRIFALVLADVDRFKPINDTYGHAAGDTVLQELAGRLAKGIRSTDRLARIGGDEFAAILWVDSEAATDEAMQRLRFHLDEPMRVQDRAMRVGMSFGTVLWRPGMTTAGILAEADRAMYREKRAIAA
ncbi:sensor domain-containing diguanylate cyclase [Aureimonas phyllosphaerae]|uniref:Diguanylate cyclase (GGDEF)-like protein/PAS domain S-box-containing protein n=1 Tax=Aureimonas phyllosphaerae TaxID=1166078 RepID=A0A7W6BVM3_9HYPH|nr:diguanylate cyclase [Aureimonas phyllosphaerae]MBB3934541.1 diguanylate cyclase (GGDEF)-like protein/PAS domain S-box-containing protein [Aureimonas phyllosphaerae]MBB3958243.1 diguanylate cyclase (GGDEF)-like protein/PAS domain S-box-containing protein [Aureimonas phyllosphaerae]SFE94125.1 PAS domain S-box-containing protein/diguanylate cyclase (GGDEF) domain-containing protein [Aureimonas phyllosphaerae]